MIHRNVRILTQESGNTLTLTVVGEIDHHGAGSLREALDEAMLEARPERVSLDLSKVDFMDSSGLGLLMGRKATADKLGSAFSVKNPTRRVARIMELAGLGKIIPIEYQSDKKEQEL